MKFVTDKDNKNVLYAECIIPWDLFYEQANGEKIDIKYEDYCNGDGSLKTNDKGEILLDKDFPGIRDFIAYRIPTEELYSTLNLKAVKFTTKVNGGGIIQVPLQGTKIAGFDFDIDKLYFMRKEFRLNESNEKWTEETWKRLYKTYPEIESRLRAARDEYEKGEKIANVLFSIFDDTKNWVKDDNGRPRLHYFWEAAGLTEIYGDKNQFFASFAKEKGLDLKLGFETYDFNKVPWDKSQSKIGRNNLLLEMMQGRLRDPQSIKQRLIPGGFETAIKAANEIKDLMGISDESKDYSDPMTLVEIYQQNVIAGKLIGVFANQNANHAMASNLYKFELATPIKFGSVEHCLRGLSNLLNPEALTKELLAASVDAVKQPVLNFLNFNTITADSAGLLTRLGYSFKEMGLLFNQPIIRYLCDYMANNNISDIETAKRHILSKNELNIQESAVNSAPISSEILTRNLLTFKESSEFWNDADNRIKQLEVLQLFTDIYNQAKAVGKFVTSTKFTASNAAKSTFGGMIAQQLAMEDFLQQSNSENKTLIVEFAAMSDTDTGSIFFDDEDLTSVKSLDGYMRRVMNNSFGFEQVMYDANRGAVKAASKYFPYNRNAYVQTIRFINNLCNGSLNEKTVNAVLEQMLKYQFEVCNDGNNIFNPECLLLVGDKQVSAKEYFKYMVPVRIKNTLIKYPELKDKYPILAALTFEEQIVSGDVTEGFTKKELMYIDNIGALGSAQKETLTESWANLIEDAKTSGNQGLKELAEALYMYSYYYDGFGFGNIGFNHLAPTVLKTSLIVNDLHNSENEVVDVDTYTDVLYSVLNTPNSPVSEDNLRVFLTRLYLNNINNTQLVYEVKSKDLNNLQTKIQNTQTDVIKFDTKSFACIKSSKFHNIWRPVFTADIQGMGKCLFIMNELAINSENPNANTNKEQSYSIITLDDVPTKNIADSSNYEITTDNVEVTAQDLDDYMRKIAIQYVETLSTQNSVEKYVNEQEFYNNLKTVLTTSSDYIGKTNSEIYKVLEKLEQDVQKQIAANKGVTTEHLNKDEAQPIC